MQPWIFDVIVVAVILVSAIMSLGRGLIREAFSVISFIVGGLIGYWTVVFLKEPVKGAFNLQDDMLPTAVLFVAGFLLAYMAAAFLGGRLSRLIHSSPEIGVLDRLAGAVFGLARGILAMVLFVLLVKQVLPDAEPEYISKARSYAVLNPAAELIRDTVPGFVKSATAAVKDPALQTPGGDGR